MGCDIHMLVEVYIEDRWQPLYPPVNDGCSSYVRHRELDIDRKYSLFALLAGVRNLLGVTPIVEPRGLPKDMPEEYSRKNDYTGLDLEDGHTHSYLTAREIFTHQWARPYPGLDRSDIDIAAEFLMRHFCKAVADAWSRGVCEPQHVRFVFCFDN